MGDPTSGSRPKDSGELLHAVDEARAGTGPGGVGVDRVDRYAVGQRAAGDQVVGETLRALAVEAAGSHDDQIVVARNPGYWGGAPKSDSLRIRIIPEALTQAAEYESGALE